VYFERRHVMAIKDFRVACHRARTLGCRDFSTAELRPNSANEVNFVPGCSGKPSLSVAQYRLKGHGQEKLLLCYRLRSFRGKSIGETTGMRNSNLSIVGSIHPRIFSRSTFQLLIIWLARVCSVVCSWSGSTTSQFASQDLDSVDNKSAFD
jgi:hypothetical protein